MAPTYSRKCAHPQHFEALDLCVTNRTGRDVELMALPPAMPQEKVMEACGVPAQAIRHHISLPFDCNAVTSTSSRLYALLLLLKAAGSDGDSSRWQAQVQIEVPAAHRPTAQTNPWLSAETHSQACSAQLRGNGVEDVSASLIVLTQAISSTLVNVLILPRRNTAGFLGDIPDQASLASICLPGTHESAALYGWPVSTCQSSQATIAKQLNDGIRFLDIRLAPKGQVGHERLVAYHGITNEHLDFEDVLLQCWAFLDSARGCREALIMSIKQESGDEPIFVRRLYEDYIKPASLLDHRSLSRWFLDNRVPTLDEVRGKIVLLSRFTIDQGYGYRGGISPATWPNSYKGVFHYTLPSGQTVQTQDWYDIGSLSSLDAKEALIEQLCQEGGSSVEDLALNYCSGSSFPLALPPAVAKGFLGSKGNCSRAAYALTVTKAIGLAVDGINVRVRNYIATLLHSQHEGEKYPRNAANSGTSFASLEGLRAIFALDYYDFVPDLVPLLVEANYSSSVDNRTPLSRRVHV